MIENRPASLLADAAYGILPKLPLALDWSSVPELIRVATLDLGGIQPVTKAMAEAAGGTLHDKPSEGEIELFRKRGTNFQVVSLVLSCGWYSPGPTLRDDTHSSVETGESPGTDD
jgi:hypothetical protein